MRYSELSEITELVRSFEDATISRDDWGHAEHLIVALHYLTAYDERTAYIKMRDGIKNLLIRGFQINLAEEMPYHETLTVFWMKTVADFMIGRADQPLTDIAKQIISTFDKDYPLQFYSRDLLFSDAARAEFVEPDLK